MKSFINTIGNILPLSMLKAGKGTPVLLPFYHTVSDEELPSRLNYNYPSVSRFMEDLDFLLKHFKPVPLEQLVSGNIPSNAFHLSFDDGLRSCYEIIAPILKEKGIPATFFINPAFVDNKDLFHRYKASILQTFFTKNDIQVDLQRTYADLNSLDETATDVGIDWKEYLQNEKPYMSFEEIKALQKDGFTIGAHSWDHPEFWLLDADHQLNEIRESMNWVVEKLAPSIKAFAFPFTDFGVSDEVFGTIRKEQICDISFGTAGLKKENIPAHFQRIAMDSNESKSASHRIKTEYFSYHLKRLFNQHIAKR